MVNPSYKLVRKGYFKMFTQGGFTYTKLLINLGWLGGAIVAYGFLIVLRSYLVNLLAASLSNQMKY